MEKYLIRWDLITKKTIVLNVMHIVSVQPNDNNNPVVKMADGDKYILSGSFEGFLDGLSEAAYIYMD